MEERRTKNGWISLDFFPFNVKKASRGFFILQIKLAREAGVGVCFIIVMYFGLTEESLEKYAKRTRFLGKSEFSYMVLLLNCVFLEISVHCFKWPFAGRSRQLHLRRAVKRGKLGGEEWGRRVFAAGEQDPTRHCLPETARDAHCMEWRGQLWSCPILSGRY